MAAAADNALFLSLLTIPPAPVTFEEGAADALAGEAARRALPAAEEGRVPEAEVGRLAREKLPPRIGRATALLYE